MNMSVRYSLLSDAETNDVLILDAETGTIQHPVCWQDLVAYYNYLMGLGRVDESQKLLAESIAGKKPITKMLEYASSSSYTDMFSR
jgi:hypothetical protein